MEYTVDHSMDVWINCRKAEHPIYFETITVGIYLKKRLPRINAALE